MKKKYLAYLTFLLAITSLILISKCTIRKAHKTEIRGLTFMFYNVESLFDTIDDPHTSDNEYTPHGINEWNSEKYFQKLSHLSRVICSVDSHFPAFVGLCETENLNVLQDLVSNKEIAMAKYQIIWFDSNDPRGIDIAALYKPEYITIIDQKTLPIWYKEKRFPRDILYITALIFPSDTIHIFINHWKSRMGGEKKTAPSRIASGKALRHYVDSLFVLNPNMQIVIMGDFNDEPNDESLKTSLKALSPNAITDKNLYNLTLPLSELNQGTYHYKNKWNMLDNIIVSSGLLSQKTWHTTTSSVSIFNPTWLLIDNPKAGEPIPFRTYNSHTHIGGYSDHLPVFFKLFHN